MRIALPVADGNLCMHFGHCEKFALIDVDEAKNQIVSENYIQSPPHQPGMLPGWIADQGANFIIAGGMGGRAIELFEKLNIKVVTGATPDDPRQVVEDFLNNRLVTGDNVCDHDHEDHECSH